MPILRQWPILQRCPCPSLTHYAPRTRAPNFSLSGPHRFASSRAPRPGNPEPKWSIYNSVFINNVFVRRTTLVLLSGTLLYYGAHLETVPDVNGRRRLMLISEENLEKQCTVTYKLLRDKIKDHLLGLQDERVKRVHFVFQRLLEDSHLEGKGRRWEVMVVDNDSGHLQNFVTIIPGNKLIIGTWAISSLSDAELAHLLSHYLAHLLLQHKREYESYPRVMTPFLATIIFFNWRIYFVQFPILWVLSATYGKRLQGKQEAEAERMAVKITEKAGFEEVIGGLDERWRCK